MNNTRHISGCIRRGSLGTPDQCYSGTFCGSYYANFASPTSLFCRSYWWFLIRYILIFIILTLINNIGLILISTCDHSPGSIGSVTCDTRGGANIFSKCCSWFVKLFVGQPRLHKVKLSNIQHSCPQTNEPINTLKRITNKQTFQVHVVFMSTNKRTLNTYWHTIKNHKQTNIPSSCILS